MFGIGMPEMAVIIVVALVVLGPKRLPEVARALGKGLAEFRKVTGEVNRELEAARNMIENEAREHERQRRALEAERLARAKVESGTTPPAAVPTAAPSGAAPAVQPAPGTEPTTLSGAAQAGTPAVTPAASESAVAAPAVAAAPAPAGQRSSGNA